MENAALRGALEAESTVVLLAGGQTVDGLVQEYVYACSVNNQDMQLLTRSTSGRSSTTAKDEGSPVCTGKRCAQTRTKVVVLQADFSVARCIGVPVRDGLDPSVEAAVLADGGRKGGTKGAEDGHRRRRRRSL